MRMPEYVKSRSTLTVSSFMKTQDVFAARVRLCGTTADTMKCVNIGYFSRLTADNFVREP